MSLSSQKYGFGIRDPGSGKNLFRIPDPGVKKAPDPGFRIPDPDPQHCFIRKEKGVRTTVVILRLVDRKVRISAGGLVLL